MTSRLYLPSLKTPPSTVLLYLAAHFPHIPESVWVERLRRGVVMLDNGTVLTETSPYVAGVTVLYNREVLSEPPSAEDETIIYSDAEIIVADKPHGMPVTPAGDYMERSLLVRLQRRTGIATLTPMHRLDRDTAGLVLFAIRETTRARYHRLFAKGAIEREYIACADVVEQSAQTHWRVENRVAEGDPWYRRQIIDGPVNAITDIELIEVRDHVGRFRLKPHTGKQHQLRLHMASIGFPIIDDPLYPSIREVRGPLQLLAQRLAFTDPVIGQPRTFRSERVLLGR